MRAAPALLAAGLLACTAVRTPNEGRPIGVGGIACTDRMPGAVVLGVAQDAGFPHLGCFRACCEGARREGRREPVAALGLVGEAGWWLVDATPDLPEQVHRMGELPRGILLTHAHVGHYTGLMYLGREGLGARGMPVHCSEKMAEFLRANAPWDQLVRLGNVELRPFRAGETLALDPWLSVEPVRVPHRDEYADTHAFGIRLRGCEPLLWLPDLDRWSGWETEQDALWAQYPALAVDGSFYSSRELDGRDMSEIPHPPVVETMELLARPGGPRHVWFIHLNHTNPLWDPDSEPARELERRGFGIARTGEDLTVFLP